MRRIEKIKEEDVIYLIIDHKTHYQVRTGNLDHICNSFGISRPLFDYNVPTLISHKFGISKSCIKLYDSKEYKDFAKRATDSNKQIKFE